MSLAADLAAFQHQLRQHADPDYRLGLMRVAPTSMTVLGVRMPDLEDMAREWQQAHPMVAEAEVLALVKALWSGDTRDERLLGLELLLRYPRRIPALDWALFDAWRREIDSWPVSDLLATKVFGPWVGAKPQKRLGYLLLLTADAVFWSRRLALVATVPLNRSPKTAIPDITYALVDHVAHERIPMITKAVSWALRQLVSTDRDGLAAYLDANRSRLPAHVVREVDSKLTTGKKTTRPTN